MFWHYKYNVIFKSAVELGTYMYLAWCPVQSKRAIYRQNFKLNTLVRGSLTFTSICVSYHIHCKSHLWKLHLHNMCCMIMLNSHQCRHCTSSWNQGQKLWSEISPVNMLWYLNCVTSLKITLCHQSQLDVRHLWGWLVLTTPLYMYVQLLAKFDVA